MATEIVPLYVGEERAVDAGGKALSTTIAYTQLGALYKGNLVTLIPGEFATAAAQVRYAFNPWLSILKTTDANVNFTDYSYDAQDNSTSTSVVLSSQDTLANGDALYVGAIAPFRGVDIDVDGTNSTGSRTLTVDYWSGGVWTSISATDGTSSSTTLDQDGTVTWTVPTNWKQDTLKNILDLTTDPTISYSNASAPAQNVNPYSALSLYWTRWTFNGALDSSVTLDHMLAMNRSTSYAELTASFAKQWRVRIGPGGYGNIEAVTDTGTATLIVNVATASDGEVA